MENRKTMCKMQNLLSKMFMLLFLSIFSLTTLAQSSITVKGIVRDEIGDGVPGASVVVEGTINGTMTDIDGNYTLEVPSANSVLVFSFVGYHTQKEIVGNRSSIDVVLVEDTKTFDEVVVVGYGVQKKETVTGSVSSVKGADLLKSPTTNLSNAIAGRMSGVVAFQRSGEPGGDDATILIRGSNTLGNEDANKPLVVIDGVADRSGGLSRLDPNEIENISVLKDASAAIYGARAANGVILITTKRGSTSDGGKPEITYSFNMGWKAPTFKPDMADAVQYATLRNELAYNKTVVNPNSGKEPGEYTPWKTDEEIQKYRDGSDPWKYPNTNWFEEAVKDWSPSRRHSVTLSGGSNKFQYYAVFGHTYEDGIYKNSANSYEQTNLRINLDAQINDYVSVSVGMLGRQENRNYPSQGAGSVFGMIARGRPTDHAYWPNGLPGPAQERGHNPVTISSSETGYDKNRRYYIQSNASVNLKIPHVEGLKLSGSVSYDKYLQKRTRWFQPWTLYDWDGETLDANGNPLLVGALSFPDHADPEMQKWSRDQANKTLSLIGTFDRTFGDHTVNFLVGTERDESDSDGFDAYKRHFQSNTVQIFQAGGEEDRKVNDTDGTIWNRARVNFFGRMAYNYKEKYLAEFVWRADGSYIFPRDKRYGFFPGVLLGYRISEENFWKDNISWMNYLKIRGSWGQMGNDQVDPYQWQDAYKYGYGYIIDQKEVRSIEISRFPNPNITWEVANNFNVGIEGMLLNQRLYFEADYFLNNRKDILIKREGSIPLSAGLVLPAENIGKVRNTGFDFKLEWNDNIGKDFRYSVTATGVYAKNKIIFWDEAEGAPAWQKSTGYSTNTDLYYVYDGVFYDWDEVNDPNRPDYTGITTDANIQPGDMKFKDVDGDGKITPNDKIRYNRTNQPKWTWGLNIGAQYKDFDLSMLWQGAADVWQRVYFDSGAFGNYYQRIYDNRWSPDSPSHVHPRVHERRQNYWDNDAGIWNTYWMQNMNYFRLKNIELGYTLPRQLVTKTNFFTGARVYVNAHNILTFTSSKEIDPESTSGGGNGYPLSKIINVGFSLNF